MNEEITLQWIQFLKIIVIAFYAVLYGFGGVSGKWKRRFAAPFLLTLGLCVLSYWSGTFSWWFLGFFPLLSLTFHLGYGSDIKKEKIVKRGKVGLAAGLSALPIAIGSGRWEFLFLHIFLCVTCSISFGVFNITSNARTEETFLAVIYALPMAMV